MKHGVRGGIKSCLGKDLVFGISVKAPNIDTLPNYSIALEGSDFRRPGISFPPNLQPLIDGVYYLQGNFWHRNITQPVLQGIELPEELDTPEEVDEADTELGDWFMMYEPLIKAAKIPTSYPYRDTCDRFPPSSSIEDCDSWGVDLVPAYQILTRDVLFSDPYHFFSVLQEGRYFATSSRVIRIDGKQSLVTYVIQPGTGGGTKGTLGWGFNYDNLYLRPPDIQEAHRSIGQGFFHGMHFQIGIESGKLIRKVNVQRLCTYGENKEYERLMATVGSYQTSTEEFDRDLYYTHQDVEFIFGWNYYYSATSPSTARVVDSSGIFRLGGGGAYPSGDHDTTDPKGAIVLWQEIPQINATIPGCHSVYYGKDFYIYTGYNPYLLKIEGWNLGRLKYDEVPNHTGASAADGVSNGDCSGEWLIALPSTRAYLLTEPPPAKDLSEYGLDSPPSQRLPDEPWVIAVNKNRTRLVTGRALNNRRRSGNSFYDEFFYWDGTLDDGTLGPSEIENVIVWDTFSAEILLAAGLPTDYEITDIRIRSYQHINGKDYVIFSTPGPPRFIDINADFEQPELYIVTDEDTFEEVFVGPRNYFLFSNNLPPGIEFIPNDGVAKTFDDHRWVLDTPIGTPYSGTPSHPYSSGATFGTDREDTRFDEGLYRLRTDEINPFNYATLNTTQYRVLTNEFAGPPNTVFDAHLELYVEVGDGSVIEFSWRFNNKLWVETQPGFFFLSNLPEVNSFLEFRINNEVVEGDWDFYEVLDSSHDPHPFHVTHGDDWDLAIESAPEIHDMWRRFRLVMDSEHAVFNSPGAYKLEWIVHVDSVAPPIGGNQGIGKAFMDDIRVTKVRIPDDEDDMLRWYYDGDTVRECKHVHWAFRDIGSPTEKPYNLRTKRVPDFITVDDPTNIEIDDPNRKILYGNPHYLARVKQNGVLDLDFGGRKHDQQVLDSDNNLVAVTPGFFVWTSSPLQWPVKFECDDDGNPYYIPLGQAASDPPWGAFQIMPCKCKIQVRGTNGELRDATDVNLAPLKVNKDSPLLVVDPSDVDSFRESLNLEVLPGWEKFDRWQSWLKPFGGFGWNNRAHAWTLNERGKLAVPHLEVIWAPYFDSPSWPTTDWPDPPYPSSDIWDWNRPRDPRNVSTWEELEGGSPGELYQPIHYSPNNYLVAKSYTDALSHYPQFVWAKDFDGEVYEDRPSPWELVVAWHGAGHGNFDERGPWSVFFPTLTWTEFNKCFPDDEELEIERRTTVIRPTVITPGISITSSPLTDFDAVDCDCCGS